MEEGPARVTDRLCAVLSIHRAEAIDHAVRMEIRGYRRRTGFVFSSGGIRHAGMHGEVSRQPSCSIDPKIGTLARVVSICASLLNRC